MYDIFQLIILIFKTKNQLLSVVIFEDIFIGDMKQLLKFQIEFLSNKGVG